MKRSREAANSKSHSKENKMDITVKKAVFDLATMDEVTLVKTAPFTPIVDMNDFMARVGNDTAKAIAVINSGLVDVAKTDLKNSETPWSALDENDKIVPFEGTPANKKNVNNLILTLAKTIFGFVNSRDAKDKEAAREKNRAAKEKALNYIKNDEQIKTGLIETAQAEDAEETE